MTFKYVMRACYDDMDAYEPTVQKAFLNHIVKARTFFCIERVSVEMTTQGMVDLLNGCGPIDSHGEYLNVEHDMLEQFRLVAHGLNSTPAAPSMYYPGDNDMAQCEDDGMWYWVYDTELFGNGHGRPDMFKRISVVGQDGILMRGRGRADDIGYMLYPYGRPWREVIRLFRMHGGMEEHLAYTSTR